MSDFLYPSGGLWVFILVTLVLGGAAAWTTGRAVARAWRPWILVLIYMLGLAAAVHFLHYALFDQSFFAPHYYLVDYVVLALSAGLGYRRMRARQMVQQYVWSYSAQGIFFWREEPALDQGARDQGRFSGTM